MNKKTNSFSKKLRNRNLPSTKKALMPSKCWFPSKAKSGPEPTIPRLGGFASWKPCSKPPRMKTAGKIKDMIVRLSFPKRDVPPLTSAHLRKASRQMTRRGIQSRAEAGRGTQERVAAPLCGVSRVSIRPAAETGSANQSSGEAWLALPCAPEKEKTPKRRPNTVPNNQTNSGQQAMRKEATPPAATLGDRYGLYRDIQWEADLQARP